jgi:acyl dehydratase
MPSRYYEDFEEGAVLTYGPRTMTREEIIAFAAEYDPQPMHLDEEAAKKTMLGGLGASGYHTCCFMFRMTYDGFLADSSSMGSPGIDEVKWLQPVRPGMPLTLRLTIVEKRTSKSRPEMGFVRLKSELLDERQMAVIEQTSTVILGLRPAA